MQKGIWPILAMNFGKLFNPKLFGFSGVDA